MIKLRLILFVMVAVQSALAQNPTVTYDNKVYQPFIKTVECYNSKKEQSFPIIPLKGSETITFAFDDIRGGGKTYSYSIEHCTYDWKPSRINTLDFVESFNEDILFNGKYSSNTLQKFTHYQLTLPNQQVKPKIGGNYLLRVYEGSSQQKLIITQRFYVVDNAVGVAGEIVPSNSVEFRTSKQKINFTIAHSMPIQNPYQDIKAVVMQNGIPETASLNTRPAFIKQGSLAYNDINTNDFFAGNEFRKFDTRSVRYKAEHVQEIFRDTAINVILSADLPNGTARYSNQLDENGDFFIRNQDGRDNITESDYANILFTLNAVPPTPRGSAYVVGRFNNYSLNNDNRLNYDPLRKRYYVNIKLKQGVYDFKYAWVPENGGFDDTVFEGSFFETKNTYQILVYYRKPTGRQDELVGFSSLTN